MKKLIFLIALFYSITGDSQSLYIPSNPDSILVPVNVNNTVRKVYEVDLNKNSATKTKVAADSAIIMAAVNSGGTISAKTDTAKLLQTASYVIEKISTTTYARPAYKSGLPAYSGTTSSTIINNALANLTSGGTMFIRAANYTITAKLVDGGNSNINLIFEKGAKLTAGAALNDQVIELTNVSHWRITYAEIDGSTATQTNRTLDPSCIFVDGCNDVIIDHAYLYGGHEYGVFIKNNNTYCGIQNSTITLCDWNGITFGGNYTGVSCFAKHNDISNSGDVGISTYSNRVQISDNYVHDIQGSLGFNNGRWGIGVEGGSGNVVDNNYVVNTNTGIHVSTSVDSNIVSNNHVYAWDLGNSFLGAIELYGNYNTAFNNVVSKNFGTASVGFSITGNKNVVNGNRTSGTRGILLNAGSDDNIIENNTIVGSSGAILISAASSDNTRILNNDWKGSGGDVSDAGTGTKLGNNVWADGSMHLSDSAHLALAAKESILTFSSPLARSTNNISIPVATTVLSGYLSPADWNTFNGKQAALVSGTNIKTINSATVLGSGNIALATNQNINDSLIANAVNDRNSKSAGDTTVLYPASNTIIHKRFSFPYPLFSTHNAGDSLQTVKLSVAGLGGSGTPSATTYLRGDSTWGTPTGSGDVTLAGVQTFTGVKTFAPSSGTTAFNFTGHIVPTVNNSYDVGTSDNIVRWGYFGGANIPELHASYHYANAGDHITFYQNNGSTSLARFSGDDGEVIFQSGGTYTPHHSVQVGINSLTKGFQLPRMTTAQIAAISSPDTSVLAYDKDSTRFAYYNSAATAWNYLGRVDSVRFVNTGVIYSSPATFSRTGGTAVVTQSLATQTANTVLSGPTSGGAATPTFRALGYTDVPVSYFTLTQGVGATMSPADATLYYFSPLVYTASATTTVGQRQVTIPVNCTLVGYSITTQENGAATSQEASTVSIRINNTTDVQLSNAVTFSASNQTAVSFYGMALSTSITAGDTYEIKWLTPTWTTNPLQAVMSVTLYLKPR